MQVFFSRWRTVINKHTIVREIDSSLGWRKRRRPSTARRRPGITETKWHAGGDSDEGEGTARGNQLPFCRSERQKGCSSKCSMWYGTSRTCVERGTSALFPRGGLPDRSVGILRLACTRSEGGARVPLGCYEDVFHLGWWGLGYGVGSGQRTDNLRSRSIHARSFLLCVYMCMGTCTLVRPKRT